MLTQIAVASSLEFVEVTMSEAYRRQQATISAEPLAKSKNPLNFPLGEKQITVSFHTQTSKEVTQCRKLIIVSWNAEKVKEIINLQDSEDAFFSLQADSNNTVGGGVTSCPFL
jgi:hypothetical protein